MNPQLSISYPASYVGRENWNTALDIIRAAVKHLTAKEVAHVLDVNGTHLSDALHERDRKVWHAHWNYTLKAMLVERGDEVSLDLLSALVDVDVAATPFAITTDVELTPEEVARRALAELARFGAAGKAAAERAKGKVRR